MRPRMTAARPTRSLRPPSPRPGSSSPAWPAVAGKIGDSCLLSSDCAPDSNLICDQASLGRLLHHPGCDYGTCPGDAVCIRFFTAAFENLPCDPATEDLGPSRRRQRLRLDEFCALAGQCVRIVLRGSLLHEELRQLGRLPRRLRVPPTRPLMVSHGGEPVPPAGQRLTEFDSLLRAGADHAVSPSPPRAS